MLIDRPQQAFGIPDPMEGRHQHQRHTCHDRHDEPGDQPHIVVQRQPTDDHVLVIQSDRLTVCVDLVEHGLMGEGNPLLQAGRTGTVLQEGNLLAGGALPQTLTIPAVPTKLRDLIRAQHAAVRLRQQFGEILLEFREGDHRFCLFAGHQGFDPLHVQVRVQFLSEKGEDRWDRAEIEGTPECGEQHLCVLQYQNDKVFRLNADLFQGIGKINGLPVKLAGGYGSFAAVLIDHDQNCVVGLVFRPLDHGLYQSVFSHKFFL